MSGDNLDRFIEAQQNDYAIALKEIQKGQKRSHWMWYIFPQIAGLGHSSTSKFYAMENIQEAKLFLEHPVLGKRLVEISNELLKLNRIAQEIFGSPDDMKLLSCMTLFEYVSEQPNVFREVIDKFYDGKRDARTLQLISA